MRKLEIVVILWVCLLFVGDCAFAAYHHEGENDADKFLSVYPDKKGTKLDHCALCHSGGEYENKGKMTKLGSCQWCHYSYGYDGSGSITGTINSYGMAYFNNGGNTTAIENIETLDSDGDGYTNQAEITAGTFPGNEEDYPGLTQAPYRVYTKEQLAAMPSHTQFLLMNTSRSGDFYAEYKGVPIEDLLTDAGILTTATGIRVYAPDGWAQDHPLDYVDEAEMYHVRGTIPGQTYQYPPATYYYETEADQNQNPNDGWCDYSASSCSGRSHGDQIYAENGLKAILAYQREGADLEAGILTDENKLDGEGPFRVVVPQKIASAPDQSSKADNQNVVWPYEEDWDHNAGACTRTATIIKVEPLPEGTTDIDVLEAGWSYVDQEKIIVYGAIDGTDSNGNGILDSEEAFDKTKDYDGDGTLDYMDADTAYIRQANGVNMVGLHTSSGAYSAVKVMTDSDSSVSQTDKPALSFPYGVVDFTITGVTAGGEVTVDVIFPENVPTTAKYYKITESGWQEISFGSNDGDNVITLTLKDGDSATDADGAANGSITDPGALAVSVAAETTDDDSDSSSCFIGVLF